jgi:alanine racemase
LASRRKAVSDSTIGGEGLEDSRVPALILKAGVEDAGPSEDRAGAFVPAGEIDMRTSIRPTVAEVDLGAIVRNRDRLQALVGGSQVWGVIKGDAYGHGAVPVALAIADGCAALAVSLVEEGLELRAAGLRGPIVVLGAYYGRCHAQVLENQLTPVLYDAGDLDRFAEVSARQRPRPRIGRDEQSQDRSRERFDVHVKVDTGMSRLGIAPPELGALLDRLEMLPALRLSGLCTHFASADVAGPETHEAMARFQPCIDEVLGRGLGPITLHAANSAAAVCHPATRLDAVRPGLALFGASPAPSVALPGFEPALRLTTRVMAMRNAAPGTGVSYGLLWRAARPSRIATLPVGYADGYPRHVRRAEVLIRGQRCPVIGAVCMDMMMIDVTDVAGASIGDVVTLLGADGADHISVDELARMAGTVNYEILCGISKRVPRVYKSPS